MTFILVQIRQDASNPHGSSRATSSSAADQLLRNNPHFLYPVPENLPDSSSDEDLEETVSNPDDSTRTLYSTSSDSDEPDERPPLTKRRKTNSAADRITHDSLHSPE